MKALIEKSNDGSFIQIFEEDCFGPDVEPVNVFEFKVIKDSWDRKIGKDIRRIHKAEVVTLLKK